MDHWVKCDQFKHKLKLIILGWISINFVSMFNIVHLQSPTVSGHPENNRPFLNLRA